MDIRLQFTNRSSTVVENILRRLHYYYVREIIYLTFSLAYIRIIGVHGIGIHKYTVHIPFLYTVSNFAFNTIKY